jgi:hypothetical protein
MMIWTDSNLRAVELHLRELRAQAAQDRLARQARRARPRRPPRRLRRHIGMTLIAAGEALTGQALDLACQPNRAP